MSGFLVVTGSWAERFGDERFANRICASMSSRGAVAGPPLIADGVAVVASQHELLCEGRSVTPNVVQCAPFLVATDATLYYRDELRQRLKESPAGASAAHMITSAFAEFGDDCLKYLEGDFAFATWDARARRLFAARDPFGTRALFHAYRDGSVAISSTPDPLRVLLGDPELDRRELIRAITGYCGDGTGSAWKGISELPAGWSLVAEGAPQPRATRFWYPKQVNEWQRASSADAALLLRDLIADAMCERMPSEGAAIGMSGGRDSTALVGAVEDRRRRNNGNSIPPLRILSYQYPEGDPGNEDTFVNQMATHFALPVHWIDTNSVPVFHDAITRAGQRVRPEAQPFEGVNRALAAATRQSGLSVVLNGNGGDSIFFVPDIWLADLFRSGKWMQLSRELRARRNPGIQWLLRTCVRPAVPLFLEDAAERVLGRRITSRPWETDPPTWLAAGLMEREGIVDEDRASYTRDIARRTSAVGTRMRLWALLYAGFSRNCAALYDMSLDEGVELRMPMYDQRVVNFGWSRPEEDLNNGIEPKVILRKSMSGVLPTDVLAVRARRTGTSEGYFRRMANLEFDAFARPTTENPVLAQMGIVDELLLRRSIDGWHSAAERQQVPIVSACAVERWLRAHI